jgi:hypothetical protein
MEEDSKMKCTEVMRSSDKKLVTLKGLMKYCRANGVDQATTYPYRQREEDEKPSAWIHGKELNLWINDKEVGKAAERYLHMEGEKRWKRQVLNSIEPNMTQERMNELKITIQVQLMDEQYQIMMDGVSVGEPYPMPPGMIEAIMWGKPTSEDINKGGIK